jgi:large subunit ribosomal protein L24
MHLHREDTVLVLSGRDKGKKGRVIRLFPGREVALVEKVNMVKRHTRPNQQLPQGGILEKEAPIHFSNLQVVCSKCGKATRVAKKALADGRKVRACKKCGEILDKEK